MSVPQPRGVAARRGVNRVRLHPPPPAAGRYVNVSASSGAAVCIMLFELPRFGREFELLSSGALQSRDHQGHVLSGCQQLVNVWSDGPCTHTLPDLTRYLILDKSSPTGDLESQVVIMPVGHVVRRSGSVDIGHAHASGADLKVRAGVRWGLRL